MSGNVTGRTEKGDPKSVMKKQGSSIISSPKNSKKQTGGFGRDQGGIKPAEKSYVKKKKLDIEYENPEYQTKNIDVKYDLDSIISRINQFHKFTTPASNWLLGELNKKKNQLPPKAIQILNTPGLSAEATLRLLNLKNCVDSI